jgi:hypothetical protein
VNKDYLEKVQSGAILRNEIFLTYAEPFDSRKTPGNKPSFLLPMRESPVALR